jgi:mRNA-degrading endonuclease RelE of RelBE toxin-antitoxin system
MRPRSQVKFVDESLRRAYYSLEKGDSAERELFKWLTRAFSDLEENAFCGIQIQKRLIPKSYLRKYRVDNLWKYDLPKGWRLLYSVRGDEIIVISIILEWLPHKEYERRFGY